MRQHGLRDGIAVQQPQIKVGTTSITTTNTPRVPRTSHFRARTQK